VPFAVLFSMTAKSGRRAYVVGAYLPNGGTLMAYHLGRILEEEFGFGAIAVAVGDETADHGIHRYALRMPLVSLAQMEREITRNDVLIVNPSFSSHQFGWRLPGFKISYVQHFNTFALLDRKLDHFVAVSDFVGNFLRAVYDLDARVIPPFIETADLPPATPWAQRPATLVQPYRKGTPEAWEISWQRLRAILAERAPHITLAEPLAGSGVPHRELLARLGAVRYFLALSAAEGFGLVPLEAMSMGALVVGYDGFGGRHYMRSGDNCAVAPHPQIEHVADLLVDAVDRPERSAAMAERGRETARGYSYDAFRRAWIDEFRRALDHEMN
jgi:glycosyltransferase involved in cell wall biosynthesis